MLFSFKLSCTAWADCGLHSGIGALMDRLKRPFALRTGAKQYQLVWGQWLHSSWSALSDNPTGITVGLRQNQACQGRRKKKRASSHFWMVWNSKTHHGSLGERIQNHWNASKFPLPGLFALHSCDGCDCWLCVTTRRSVESFWWGQSKNNDPAVF